MAARSFDEVWYEFRAAYRDVLTVGHKRALEIGNRPEAVRQAQLAIARSFLKMNLDVLAAQEAKKYQRNAPSTKVSKLNGVIDGLSARLDHVDRELTRRRIGPDLDRALALAKARSSKN
jgi:hypothetical protein